MNGDTKNRGDDALRQRAEERFRRVAADSAAMASTDVRALVQELGVHQVELEIQNEELREAQEALIEARDRYQDLYELAPVGYLTLDSQGTVLEVNRAAARVCNRPGEHLVGGRFQQCLHPDDGDTCSLLLRNVRVEGNQQAWEARLVGAEKECRHVRIEAAPRMNPDGSAGGFRVTLTDVTERRRAEEALQEADRRKDEFLATLGHELRNPLAALITGLEVQQLLPPGPELERILGMMDRQARQLSRLVDDLLDVARISRGTINLRRERLDLTEALRETVAEVPHGQISPNLRVTLDLPEEPLPLDADTVRLSQILGNLLGNAAKFSPEGGEIFVRAHREGHCGVVSVRDEGVGIDPETLSRIFDLFAQGRHLPFLEHGGLGIGLAMVRKLVELHGGSVEAHSDGMGHGSEFTVRLPLADAAPGPSGSSP